MKFARPIPSISTVYSDDIHIKESKDIILDFSWVLNVRESRIDPIITVELELQPLTAIQSVFICTLPANKLCTMPELKCWRMYCILVELFCCCVYSKNPPISATASCRASIHVASTIRIDNLET